MLPLLVRWLLFSALAIPCLAAETPADPVGDANSPWLRDYASARELAGRNGRLLLLNFTGSDWCIWCHRLRDEVFSQKPFLDFAQSSLVLVEVDFPRKHPLPPAQREAHATLAARYGVEGYPTVVLVDASGRELGRTGYTQGGAKSYVRELKRLIRQTTPTAKPAPPPSA